MVGCRVARERLRDAGFRGSTGHTRLVGPGRPGRGLGTTRTGPAGATGSTGHTVSGSSGPGLMYERSISLRDAGSGRPGQVQPERLALPVLRVLPGWDDPDNARAGSDLPDPLALLDRRQAASPFPAGFPGGGVLGQREGDRRNPVASRGFPSLAGQTEASGRGLGTRFRLVTLESLDAGSTGFTGVTGSTGVTGRTGTPGRR